MGSAKQLPSPGHWLGLLRPFYGLLGPDGKTAVRGNGCRRRAAARSPETARPAPHHNLRRRRTAPAGSKKRRQTHHCRLGRERHNDGGAGAMQALGVRFYDADGGSLLPEKLGGAALSSLARIDASGLRFPLSSVQVIIASDVTNPLLGPQGASAVYGPQKAPMPRWSRNWTPR